MSNSSGHDIGGRLGGLAVLVVAVIGSSGIVAGQGFARTTPEFGVWSIVLPIVLTALAGVALLGFFPEYGYSVLDTIAENPFVTALYGVAGFLALIVIVIVAVLFAIVPIVGWVVAFVVLVPVIVATVVWTTAGYIAIGRFFAGLVGIDTVWAGFAIGLVLFSLVQLLPDLVALPVTVPAAILGIGGGLRQWFGSGGRRTERSVPPATRV